jgi:hypothetical protein
MNLLRSTSTCRTPTGAMRASDHLIPWKVTLPIFNSTCAGQGAVQIW